MNADQKELMSASILSKPSDGPGRQTATAQVFGSAAVFRVAESAAVGGGEATDELALEPQHDAATAREDARPTSGFLLRLSIAGFNRRRALFYHRGMTPPQNRVRPISPVISAGLEFFQVKFKRGGHGGFAEAEHIPTMKRIQAATQLKNKTARSRNRHGRYFEFRILCRHSAPSRKPCRWRTRVG